MIFINQNVEVLVVRIAFLILVFLSQNSLAQLQNVVEQYEQKFQFENGDISVI